MAASKYDDESLLPLLPTIKVKILAQTADTKSVPVISERDFAQLDRFFCVRNQMQPHCP